MNKKKKLIPALRFPEFDKDEEWVEERLNDYLELLTDFEANGSFADVKKNVTVYDEKKYAWYVRATDLENNTTLDKVKYVDEHSYNFLHKTKLFGGELLITKRGEIGKVYFFNSVDDLHATVAPNMYLLKLNQKAIPLFFYYHFTNHSGNHSLKRLNASSTIGALYKDDVKNVELFTPPRTKEQQKIASCLSSLDELIITHSEKLQTLKNHKKGLMQNLFPQDGQKLPNYRFPEFEKDGKWVQKELGKIAKNLDSKRVPITSNVREKGEIPYYGASGIIDYVKDYIFDEDLLLISEDGANLIARVYPIAFSVSGKTWVNNHAHVLKFENWFTQVLVEKYLNSRNIQDFLTGMAQPKLNRGKLDIIPIPLPKNPQEQQKIASCLSAVDGLINAQTEKIEQLQQHKKGLMQGLFPKIEN